VQTKLIIDDPDFSGGATVRVEPELEILEKAARVSATPLAPSQVYALAALNALRDFTRDPESVKLPKMRGPMKGLAHRSLPVHRVTISLYDRADGGVVCDSDPKFSTLLAMVAGGSELSQVHRHAMVALGRIYQVSRDSKG
jgi:hypothetical protein